MAGLSEKDLARDPFLQFEKWFQEAEAAKIAEPNALTLCTATREGKPSARTVLLKGLDGVRQVHAHAKNQRVEVLFDAASLETATIADRLRRAGYETRVESSPSGLVG